MGKTLDPPIKQLGNRDNCSLSRRSFFTWLLGISIKASLVGVMTTIIGCPAPQNVKGKNNKPPTPVGTLSDFPDNTGKVVTVKGKSIIITNTHSGNLKAFSAICTHEGCKVKWNQRDANIHCPCHSGTYHPRTGRVISGPPPYPLRRYEITTRGEEIYVGEPI